MGVAALTTVVSVTGGFQKAFREKVLGVNSHILVMKYGTDFYEYGQIRRRLEELPGIEATAPFTFDEMMISHGPHISGVLIKGVDPRLLPTVSDIPDYIEDGSLDAIIYDRSAPEEERGSPGIIIGKELATKLQAEIGDVVNVVSPLRGLETGEWAPPQMAPTNMNFTIVGIFYSGFYEYDTRLVLIDFRARQAFFNQGDIVSGIDIRVSDIFETEETVTAIKTMLNGPESEPPRYRCLDWREINKNLFTSLELQKYTLTIILTFIVIVASFNIVSTLIMIVLDKTREIAILKSMGASNWGVMLIFLMEGLMIGGVGTLLGLAGGALICLIIAFTDFGLDPQVYLISELPVEMSPLEFLYVGAIAIAISFLATLYPSWRAAAIPPVDGLRYD